MVYGPLSHLTICSFPPETTGVCQVWLLKPQLRCRCHRCFPGTGPVPHIAFLVTSAASEQQQREWAWHRVWDGENRKVRTNFTSSTEHTCYWKRTSEFHSLSPTLCSLGEYASSNEVAAKSVFGECSAVKMQSSRAHNSVPGLHCLVSMKGHVYVLSASVVSHSVWPCGLQPAGLLCLRGFSRQEHWSVLPCPPPGDLPDSGITPVSLTSLASSGRFFTTSVTGEPYERAALGFLHVPAAPAPILHAHVDLSSLSPCFFQPQPFFMAPLRSPACQESSSKKPFLCSKFP